MENLEALGTVRHHRVSVEDITDQYVDLEARLASMRARSQLATVHLDLRRKFIPGPVTWVARGLFTGVKKLFVIRE